jgi:D-beta-D-heptose 7-phosphate kinase/D-beta-D-heptose 1-phosphate adenosyltransferase
MLNFENCKILVVGDIMLDTTIHGSTNRLSPEAPVPVLLFEKQTEALGGAGNVAANIVSLGAKCCLMGVIGNDLAGRKIKKLLNSQKIIDETITWQKSTTINKIRYMSRQQHLLRLDYEEKLSFDDNVLVDRFRDVLNNFDFVVFSDYKKGTIDRINELISICKDANVPCLVDPKGNDFRKYENATYLTPNLHEFELIVGKCNDLETVKSKSRILVNELSLGGLLVTLGDNGLVITTLSSEFYHFKATARNVFDVTGAGDTVISLLACSLSAKNSDYYSAKVANLGAGIVVTKLGTSTVNINEINSALATQGQSKIQSQADITKTLEEQRKNRNKIVFTNGCFDLLHIGHLDYLKSSKNKGDILIVGLNSDDSIKKLKGSLRPINGFEVRAKMLASLEFVDYVVKFSEKTPLNLIKKIRPDVLVKGADYDLQEVVGADFVSKYGGVIELVKLTNGFSTTGFIKKIIKNFGE